MLLQQGRSKGLAKDGFLKGSFSGVCRPWLAKVMVTVLDGLNGGCKVCG